MPSIGWVRCRTHRPVEGRILQATIKRDGEHWFISLACEVDTPPAGPLPVAEERAIGIDVGLSTFAVLSDGTEVANPRFLEKTLAKLRKAQRSLSRKAKFGRNWKKQVRKISKLHRSVRNCREDFLHKVSTAIVKNHDVIAVEDLDILWMMKNRHLSRSISDAGWGMFFYFLEYKSEWAGKHFVKVERFMATSQLCSNCHQKKPMPLSLRTFECGECGMVVDRDLNASQNIRTAGLAALGFGPNACGGA